MAEYTYKRTYQLPSNEIPFQYPKESSYTVRIQSEQKRDNCLGHKYQQSELSQYQAQATSQAQKKYERDPCTENRIQEIKRKYNTPSRKIKGSQYASESSEYSFSSKKKQNIGTSNYRIQESTYDLSKYQEYEQYKQNRRTIDSTHISSQKYTGQPRDYKTPATKNYEDFKTEDQQTVIRRIREIKSSLNKDRQTLKQSNNKNILSSKIGCFGDDLINKKMFLIGQSSEKVKDPSRMSQLVYQPRVQNIEKINTKIKSILDCLNQNERENYLKKIDKINTQFNSQYKLQRGNERQSNNYSHNPINSREPQKVRGEFVLTKYEKQQSKTESNALAFGNKIVEPHQAMTQKFPTYKRQGYENREPEKLFEKNSLSHHRHSSEADYFQVKKISDNNCLKSDIGEFNVQVNSFIGRNVGNDKLMETCTNFRDQNINKVRQINPAKSYIEIPRPRIESQQRNGKRQRSVKNFDEQIKRIQSKMKSYEQQKKKLNIEFKNCDRKQVLPTRPKSSISENLRQQSFILKNCVTQAKTKQSSTQNYLARSTLQKPPLPRSYQKQSFAVSKKQHISSLKDEKTSGFQLKLIQCQSSEPKHQIQYRKDTEEDEFKKKLVNGIEQRRKILKDNMAEHNDKSKFNIVKKFVDLLSNQASLDQKLRNCKLWLQTVRQQNKWQFLQKQLKIYQINMTIEELKKIFIATQQQNNPFFTAFECKQTYKSVAQKYYESKKNWEKNVMGSFKKQELSRQKFYEQKIDLEKKGYFVLEDLVRLLNMETGTFFRNRDLYLIYQRLGNGCKGSFQELIKIMTEKR